MRPWCWERLKAKGEGGDRVRWLDIISDSTDMNLSKLRKMAEDREAWWAAVHGVAKSQHNLETERQHLKCGFSDVSEHRIEASELAGKNQQEHKNTRNLVRSYNMQRTAERTRERFEEMLVKKFSSQCQISSHIFVKIYKNEASEHKGNHTWACCSPAVKNESEGKIVNRATDSWLFHKMMEGGRQLKGIFTILGK